jgi:peptidoglycan/xylan/chitin deacetylase (PgdA/CDA1 family)
VAAGVPLRTRGAVVLTYHDVSDGPATLAGQVSSRELRKQLTAAQNWGLHFVDLRDLTRRLRSGDSVDGLGAVAFDDALVGVHRHAVPLLTDLGVPATVFVVSSRLGTSSPPWYPNADRTMTREELLESAAAGLEIESHTRTHPDLRELEAPALTDELVGSRAELEDLLGREVTLLAYPGGFCDRMARNSAEHAGYDAAFSFDPGRIEGGLDRYALPRLPMPARAGRLRLAYTLARPAASYRAALEANAS